MVKICNGVAGTSEGSAQSPLLWARSIFQSAEPSARSKEVL